MSTAKTKPDALETLALRADRELSARVEALRVRFSTTWHEATRSDVLRAVILKGLDIYEATPPDGPASPMLHGRGRRH